MAGWEFELGALDVAEEMMSLDDVNGDIWLEENTVKRGEKAFISMPTPYEDNSCLTCLVRDFFHSFKQDRKRHPEVRQVRLGRDLAIVVLGFISQERGI